MAWEILRYHTDRISDITLLSVGSQQLYTLSIHWHKRFEFGKSRVHIWRWKSVIQNFIEEVTGNNSQYVTTTSFWHSNLLQATEHKELWWTTGCIKNSSFPLNVWTACYSKSIQSSTQYHRLLEKIKYYIQVHTTAGMSSTVCEKAKIGKLLMQSKTTTERSLRNLLKKQTS